MYDVKTMSTYKLTEPVQFPAFLNLDRYTEAEMTPRAVPQKQRRHAYDALRAKLKTIEQRLSLLETPHMTVRRTCNFGIRSDNNAYAV